jgi:predicted nucleotide-binding protein (sugar kinase/HSP70/actin superfamily)
MEVGIPKGLLYWKYHVFIETFLSELGAELVISPDTNKEILDSGIKHCVDEACLPIKVFHGHVDWLKNRCDLLIIPRIMQLRKREYICPKFCGLPEMIKNSIPGLPEIIGEPIYAHTGEALFKWCKMLGNRITRNNRKINLAFDRALAAQKEHRTGTNDTSCNIKVALLGHPYSVYDTYCNMNVRRKLNNLGIGVITEEYTEESSRDKYIEGLYKKPFWTFARNSYGSSLALHDAGEIRGIVYVSSFACGIDSVVIELIKDKIGDFPMLILKIDEHTGEAGIDTRIEAFTDMLERRVRNENKLSQSGELISCSQSLV